MLGRGIDQVLPHPGDPHLCEPAVTLAHYGYLALYNLVYVLPLPVIDVAGREGERADSEAPAAAPPKPRPRPCF